MTEEESDISFGWGVDCAGVGSTITDVMIRVMRSRPMKLYSTRIIFKPYPEGLSGIYLGYIR